MAAEYPGTDFTFFTLRDVRMAPMALLRCLGQRWGLAVAYVGDVEACPFPDFLCAVLACVPAPRRYLVDQACRSIRLGKGEGLRAVLRLCGEAVWTPYLVGRTLWEGRAASIPSSGRRKGQGHRVLYLRADAWFPLRAGGSVAHTHGVLEGLREFGYLTTVVSPTPLPGVAEAGFPAEVIPARGSLPRNVPDLNLAGYSRVLTQRILSWARNQPWAFLYQRSSLLNSSGMDVAHQCGVPFVLEFNGSDVWINQHWGRPLLFRRLAERVERANLVRADLVTVVSEPLRTSLLARGVNPERILVNPNAVDPTRYHPGVDGSPMCRRLGLTGRLVIGFIGTFGPWHGAEVLARAVRPVAADLPEAHFLFIGSGSGMPRVQAIIAGDSVGTRVTFAGMIPQEEAPAYLAACDVLVSPHVPNPDGTPFFGSPTKLFEYMAMGKGIVASDLDQIGEVLSHGKTAWLVRPGDPEDLAAGILALARDPDLRRALGEAARDEVVAKHTWKAHVERLLVKMVELQLLDPRVLDPLRAG